MPFVVCERLFREPIQLCEMNVGSFWQLLKSEKNLLKETSKNLLQVKASLSHKLQANYIINSNNTFYDNIIDKELTGRTI